MIRIGDRSETEEWVARVRAFIVTALAEQRERSVGVLEVFAVDCHPWNGVLALGYVTTAEVTGDPTLADVEEMAAWAEYDFASRLPCHDVAEELGGVMRDAYEATSKDSELDSKARTFLRAAAEAMASAEVQDALSRFSKSTGFRVSVPHPDTNEEFFGRSSD